MLLGVKAVDVRHDSTGRVSSVLLDSGAEIGCTSLIVADGARSPLGRVLGRQWHQQTVYGVAIRGYLTTPRSDEPWITSHLELRSPEGKVLPGYGWIFPLGNGEVNIGVGALATTKRPADAALRPLMSYYTDLRREEWGFTGEPRAGLSALLPMGGAVSGVAGPNWMLIGDAAACVNPLNGEGIDYGLETGRLAAELLGSGDLSSAWPAVLSAHYGRGFSVARRLALLLTFPRFLPSTGPLAMRSASLMSIAVRVMGNLVTDEDADWVARVWRCAGGVATARSAGAVQLTERIARNDVKEISCPYCPAGRWPTWWRVCSQHWSTPPRSRVSGSPIPGLHRHRHRDGHGPVAATIYARSITGAEPVCTSTFTAVASSWAIANRTTRGAATWLPTPCGRDQHRLCVGATQAVSRAR